MGSRSDVLGNGGAGHSQPNHELPGQSEAEYLSNEKSFGAVPSDKLLRGYRAQPPLSGASRLRKSGSFSEFHTFAPRKQRAEGRSVPNTLSANQRESPQHKPNPRGTSLSDASQNQQVTSSAGSASTHTAVPAVDAVERDAYGFAKQSDHVSKEQRQDFDEYYCPIVAARKAKWDTLLQEHFGAWPPPSPKVKRFVRKGVPCDLRGEFWLHYSGAEQLMRQNPGRFQELVLRAEVRTDTTAPTFDQIEKDLHRTFPENIKFHAPRSSGLGTNSLDTSQIPAIQSLRRVLRATALQVPAVGYCQSLNFICGMMLLFVPDEEKAFWLLVHLIQNMLPPGTYDITMEGANVDQDVLMALICARLPEIAAKLVDADFPADEYARTSTGGSPGGGMATLRQIQRVPSATLLRRGRTKTSANVIGNNECGNVAVMPISLVTSNWFLTLYINILPVETVLRVWDVLFYEGNKILFRVALTLFKIHEVAILALRDPLDVFQFVQNMPKRMIDCHSLMEQCFTGIAGDLSRTGIESLREVARFRRRKGSQV